jgi:hypothetical protein
VSCLVKHSKSGRVALWGLCALSRLVPDPVIRTRLAANGIVETVLKVLNRQGGVVDVVRATMCALHCLLVLYSE